MSGVLVMRGSHALCVLCRVCGSFFVRTQKDAKHGAYTCRPCSRPRELELKRAKGVRPRAEAYAARVVGREEAIRRFWTCVAKTDTCWNWTAGRDQRGYGQVKADGRQYRTHRFAWEMSHGPIPAGLVICHRCDNPSCVRVEHLFLGTQAENMADAALKNRMAMGPTHPRGKLSMEQMREIVEARGRGVFCRVLAEKYGVHPVTILRVGQGRRKTLGGRSR